MDSFYLKILCAVIILVISILFGVVLPFLYWRLSPHRRRFTRLQSTEESDDPERNVRNESSPDDDISRNTNCCLRCFSFIRSKLVSPITPSVVYCLCGGVFLGVSILDLIPDSREAVLDAMEALHVDTDYPVTEFMISVGLLFVMVVENLMSVCMKQNVTETPDHCHAVGECHGVGDADRRVSTYRMFVLVVTLSFHSVFEGLAIGLQNDVSTIYQLAIAISVHKSVITFGVGLPMFETLGVIGKLKIAVICAMIFCAASPIGCIAGAFVSRENYSSSPSAAVAAAVLQCLATGTFLYVTFLEVIPKEFSNHSHDSHIQRPASQAVAVANGDVPHVAVVNRQKSCPQLIKLLALIVGFAVASALQFL